MMARWYSVSLGAWDECSPSIGGLGPKGANGCLNRKWKGPHRTDA